MIFEDFHQIYNLTYSNKPIHFAYLQKIAIREGKDNFSQTMLEKGCVAQVPREKVIEMLEFITTKMGVWESLPNNILL